MIHKKRGFTLIELSIVLVIIGLIVGGVLVGRDLIVAAQVRKTGTLVEQIQTATMAFQNKYNCLPGDCVNATNFFGAAVFPSGDDNCGGGIAITGACNGNGDGDIFTVDYTGNANGGEENGSFFQQLIISQLLADTRYCKLHGIACEPAWYPLQQWGLNIPVPSKGHSNGNAAAIGIASLKHDTWSVGTPGPPANHALVFTSQANDGGDYVISSAIMFMLDSKFDDGYPLSGRLQAVSFGCGEITNGHCSNGGGYGGGDLCNTGATPSVYTSDNTPQCPAMWMMPF